MLVAATANPELVTVRILIGGGPLAALKSLAKPKGSVMGLKEWTAQMAQIWLFVRLDYHQYSITSDGSGQ